MNTRDKLTVAIIFNIAAFTGGLLFGEYRRASTPTPPSGTFAPSSSAEIHVQRWLSDGRRVRWDTTDCVWRDVATGEIVLAQPEDGWLTLWVKCKEATLNTYPRLLPEGEQP